MSGTFANVDYCRQLATEFHEGQCDWHGLPYIEHPLAVCELVKEAGGDEVAQCVALLHDVMEDCGVKATELVTLVGHEIAIAVLLLTKFEGESYEDYIRLVKSNKTATLVKICDITHNLSRPPSNRESEEKRAARHEKYKAALEYLKDGNQ